MRIIGNLKILFKNIFLFKKFRNVDILIQNNWKFRNFNILVENNLKILFKNIWKFRNVDILIENSWKFRNFI